MAETPQAPARQEFRSSVVTAPEPTRLLGQGELGQARKDAIRAVKPPLTRRIMTGAIEVGKAGIARAATYLAGPHQETDAEHSSAIRYDGLLARMKARDGSPVLNKLVHEHRQGEAADSHREFEKAMAERQVVDLNGRDVMNAHDANVQYGVKEPEEPVYMLFAMGDGKPETWGVFRNPSSDTGTTGEDKYSIRIAQLVSHDGGKTLQFDWDTQRFIHKGESMDMTHQEGRKKSLVRLTVGESGDKFILAPDGKATLTVLAHANEQDGAQSEFDQQGVSISTTRRRWERHGVKIRRTGRHAGAGTREQMSAQVRDAAGEARQLYEDFTEELIMDGENAVRLPNLLPTQETMRKLGKAGEVLIEETVSGLERGIDEVRATQEESHPGVPAWPQRAEESSNGVSGNPEMQRKKGIARALEEVKVIGGAAIDGLQRGLDGAVDEFIQVGDTTTGHLDAGQPESGEVIQPVVSHAEERGAGWPHIRGQSDHKVEGHARGSGQTETAIRPHSDERAGVHRRPPTKASQTGVRGRHRI